MLRLVYALVTLTIALSAAADVHHVPLFPSVNDPYGRQGFVRIINESNNAGRVVVEAIDEEGVGFGTFTVELGTGHARHFNSDVLSEQLGSGATGHWRLQVTSQTLSAYRVLAFSRSLDGFLSPLNGSIARDSEWEDGGRWRVQVFNPASNIDQQSYLRITNLDPGVATVTIQGTDDHGAQPDKSIEYRIAGGATLTIRSMDLEEAWDMDGKGKWRLEVTSTREELLVMNLLESTATGHTVNMATHRTDFFANPVDGPALSELGLPETEMFGPMFAYRLRYSDREEISAASSSGGTWVVRRMDGTPISFHEFDWDDVVEVEFDSRARGNSTEWADRLDGVQIGGSVVGIGHTTDPYSWDKGEACWIALQVEEGTRIERHVGRGDPPSNFSGLSTFSIAGLTSDPSLSSESDTCTVAPTLDSGTASYLLLPRSR